MRWNRIYKTSHGNKGNVHYLRTYLANLLLLPVLHISSFLTVDKKHLKWASNLAFFFLELLHYHHPFVDVILQTPSLLPSACSSLLQNIMCFCEFSQAGFERISQSIVGGWLMSVPGCCSTYFTHDPFFFCQFIVGPWSFIPHTDWVYTVWSYSWKWTWLHV